MYLIFACAPSFAINGNQFRTLAQKFCLKKSKGRSVPKHPDIHCLLNKKQTMLTICVFQLGLLIHASSECVELSD